MIVPPSPTVHFCYAAVNNFLLQTNNTLFTNGAAWRKKSNFGHGKRRMNSQTSMAQRKYVIKTAAYVLDIDHQVTEQLATPFVNCGQLVRAFGDPSSSKYQMDMPYFSFSTLDTIWQLSFKCIFQK